MRSQVEIYNLSGLAPEDRFGRWEEIVSSTHVPESLELPEHAPKRPFRAELRRRHVEDIAVIDVHTDPCHGYRTRQDIARSAADLIQLTMLLDGRQFVSSGDERIPLAPGTMLFTEHRSPWRFEMLTSVRMRTVLVPRSAFDEAAGRSWSMPKRLLSAADPAVRLLMGYLASISALDDTVQPSMAAAARNATLELLIGAIRSQAPAGVPGTLAALRLGVERWIEDNLSTEAGGELSVDAAAAAHHVSPRTIHRAFSDGGLTFGGAIRLRRLQRARRDLGDPSATVQAIATRWGFADASHFCRAFKAQYGLTPSDYRAG